jgi:hypothetical protein
MIFRWLVTSRSGLGDADPDYSTQRCPDAWRPDDDAHAPVWDPKPDLQDGMPSLGRWRVPFSLCYPSRWRSLLGRWWWYGRLSNSSTDSSYGSKGCRWLIYIATEGWARWISDYNGWSIKSQQTLMAASVSSHAWVRFAGSRQPAWLACWCQWSHHGDVIAARGINNEENEVGRHVVSVGWFGLKIEEVDWQGSVSAQWCQFFYLF